MSVNAVPACSVCRQLPPRFQITVLSTGKSARVCSVKCVVSWALGFGLGSVQNVVQKLLRGVPNGNGPRRQ
jgi:hypothetical protein